MNVLVVDDDKDLLDMVSLILSRYSMKVVCLDSGNQLFDRIAANTPDIILMDIYLGDSDGRDLCKQMKQLDDFKNIPVILYSAGNISAASIHESQADDFIAKPFDISHLVTRINAGVRQ